MQGTIDVKLEGVSSEGQEVTHGNILGQLDLSQGESNHCLEHHFEGSDVGGRDQPSVKDDSEGEKLTTEREYIRRQLLKADGVYVQGAIQGIRVEFTADTGAARTIVSYKMYQKLPRNKRPTLTIESTPLTSANGEQLRILGKADFKIKMGDLEFHQNLTVAEIDDECLLGLDILLDSQFGPAFINLGENVITLNNVDIPCTNVSQKNRVRQVLLMDDYTVPPRTERIVQAMISKSEAEMDLEHQTYIVEGNSTFENKHSVAVAATLVDSKDRVTVPVRILNPSHSDISLRQDEVIGQAELCREDELENFTIEETSEDHNFYNIRRIKLGFEPEVPRRPNIETVEKSNKIRQVNSIEVPPHLEDLYNRAVENKDSGVKSALAETLVRHSEVFSKHDEDLGKTGLVEHTINTGNSRPLRQPPRRVPLAFEGEEKKVIETMQKQGIIQKSTSPWASPIVLVRKKNGKVRPCIDYRRLNAVTTPDAFPLPRVQDCLDAVRGSVYFSTFHITSGYHQVPVKKTDIPKTAFITKFGLYEFKTMPMGLNTASATFQRLMELILQGLNWSNCIIYLDDIVVYGTTLEQHLQRVDQVLLRIQDSGMKLKPNKCHLLQESVNFLGHVVSKNGVLPSADNVSKILLWPSPTNVTEIRQFLGMISYYRRFIKDYSIIANPLVRLTKKNTEFSWDDQCEKAFKTLKEILTSPEIMAYPRDDEEFILDTDASGEAIGAVLSQIQDGRERVISYGSRALSKAEKNYCITDKELLAVRHFIEYYRQYLLGRKFLVRTDHQALVWIFKLKEPKDRIARWLEILSGYNFEVMHRPGSEHGNCDAMSRCVDVKNCQCEEYDNMENLLKCGPCRKCLKRMSIIYKSNEQQARAVRTRQNNAEVSDGSKWRPIHTNDEIRREQLKDPDISIVYQWVQDEQRPDIRDICLMPPAVRHYWHISHLLKISNGVLIKTAHRYDAIFHQILSPKTFRKEAMQQAHDAPLGGHLGRRKTQEKISRNMYWYGLTEDVTAHVASCQQCQQNKKLPQNPKGQLCPMLTGAPMDRISADILGPLPVTPAGNKYILTVTI